jgi:hypothetical protein
MVVSWSVTMSARKQEQTLVRLWKMQHHMVYDRARRVSRRSIFVIPPSGLWDGDLGREGGKFIDI